MDWVTTPLPGCNRHHQVDITFLVGNPNLNLHLPQASWEGGQPKIWMKNDEDFQEGSFCLDIFDE